MLKKNIVLLAIVIGLAGCDSDKEPQQSASEGEPSALDQAKMAISKGSEEITENIKNNENVNAASEKMSETGEAITESASDAAEVIKENLESIQENIESNPPYPTAEEAQ